MRRPGELVDALHVRGRVLAVVDPHLDQVPSAPGCRPSACRPRSRRFPRRSPSRSCRASAASARAPDPAAGRCSRCSRPARRRSARGSWRSSCCTWRGPGSRTWSAADRSTRCRSGRAACSRRRSDRSPGAPRTASTTDAGCRPPRARADPRRSAASVSSTGSRRSASTPTRRSRSRSRSPSATSPTRPRPRPSAHTSADRCSGSR